MAKGDLMTAGTWDPKQAAKAINLKDQQEEQQRQEETVQRKRIADETRVRKQRAISIVGPALQRIRMKAQQLCAEFNSHLENKRSGATIEMNSGPGLDGVPHSFAVVRGSCWAKFTSKYDAAWIINLQFSNQPERTFEIIEEPGASEVMYRIEDQKLTESELATEACQYVCQ